MLIWLVAPLTCVVFLEHAAVPLRLIDDTTSFSSLIIGSFDHRQRPRTVVSPRGTATTIFSPTPTVEEPSQPRALKGETLAKETIERTIQCGVQPISSVHALPPPALHPAQMKHSHSDTDLPAQETSCPRPQPLDLSESVLRVPADGHSAVLRSLGVRSSQCFGVVVNGQLEAAAAFYGSAHPIVRRTCTREAAAGRRRRLAINLGLSPLPLAPDVRCLSLVLRVFLSVLEFAGVPVRSRRRSHLKRLADSE